MTLRRRTPLSSDPEKTRQWLRRGRRKSAESLNRSRSPLQRKKGLKPVNRERRARLREEQFGEQAEAAREARCCTCGSPPPSVPHHVRSRAAGGTDGDVCALCWWCHEELHRIGQETFADRYDVDLKAEAKRLAEEG